MGKASEPPKCKSCGKSHWGTCMDHDNRGYLSNRAAPAAAEVKQQRIAKANEVLAAKTASIRDGATKPRKPRAATVTAPPAGAGGEPDRQPKPRGRPKTVPDRKAYLAQKARERRANRKVRENGPD